jgi:hypothetical protein
MIKLIINIIVYIGSLFKDAFSVIQTKSRQIKDDKWMIKIGKDLEGSGRGVILRYYPSIRL